VIIGAICARGGSKGVPRKNLRLLDGEPLLVHAIRCARACPSLDCVVVSTDDAEMAEAARRHGAEVPFLRPAALAQDDTPKWPVFRHLVESWEERSGETVRALIDLDTGVPLRQPADVEGCVRQLLARDADVVVTAYEAERNPYFNMVEIEPDGYARISKPTGEPITRRQAAPRVYSLSPSVFAIRRRALWQYEHWSESRFEIFVVPRERALDIDTELDFQFVRFLLETNSCKT
jgi:N-acylneuraminate cytidylyltransferase/CMP-N,N'-diacetyllegionaminic acid synthase